MEVTYAFASCVALSSARRIWLKKVKSERRKGSQQKDWCNQRRRAGRPLMNTNSLTVHIARGVFIAERRGDRPWDITQRKRWKRKKEIR